MLEVVSDDLYRREPHAILETFLVFQTVGMNGLSARTLRALYNARTLMNGDFRKDPANRATFMQILQQRSGITHAMRLMNQTSVLGRYLWAFRKIVGQMQHDLFHVYTVDQHVLMVLRNVAGTGPGSCMWRPCSTTSPKAAAATTPDWAKLKRGAFANSTR